MMRVEVRFAGLVRRYLGERERVFDLPEGSTAGDLLLIIGREYGSRLPPSMWDEATGRFHRSVRLARSGAPVLGESEELHEGDQVIFIFALAGG